jgi:hypothetical protein
MASDNTPNNFEVEKFQNQGKLKSQTWPRYHLEHKNRLNKKIFEK